MEIKHVRFTKPVLFAGLVKGNVYIDAYGSYILATDGPSVVDLQNGEIPNITAHYQPEDPFIPVEATLEIK